MLNKITEYRKKAGLNQKELGKLLGVAQTTVSGWERGYREPDNESLIKLQKILNVPIEKFMNWEVDENDILNEEMLREEINVTTTNDYPEIISIANAAEYMDKDQRERMLIITKAAFPTPFIKAEQKLKKL